MLVEAALAFAVLGGGDGATPKLALPFHPVAGSFKPDETTVEECGDQVCFEQALGNIAYYKGPRRALTVFQDIYGDGADPGCHRVAHAIGAASLARYEGNVARTFAEGSSYCWSGYYHGVLERSLVNVPSRKANDLGAVARSLCGDDQVRAVTWLAYQCLHGLGHGLMITTGLSLPRSLQVCKSLATDWDRESCKGGVFMENLSPAFGVQSRWLRDDDPVYPCNVVADEDKRECYETVTTRILRVVGVEWEQTADICGGVENGFIASCFRSFGRDISAQTHRNPSAIAGLCAVARPYGGEGECIAAGAIDMTANYTSGERASALCETAAANLRDGCYRAIGSIMGGFRSTEAEREGDCRSITSLPRYVAQCIRGTASIAPLAGVR
jgi:hypothetical protein